MLSGFNADQARKNAEGGLYDYERMLREILANTEAASRMRFYMSTSSYNSTTENRIIIDQVAEELETRGFNVKLVEVGEKIFVEVGF